MWPKTSHLKLIWDGLPYRMLISNNWRYFNKLGPFNGDVWHYCVIFPNTNHKAIFAISSTQGRIWMLIYLKAFFIWTFKAFFIWNAMKNAPKCKLSWKQHFTNPQLRFAHLNPPLARLVFVHLDFKTWSRETCFITLNIVWTISIVL